jgi:hypothetical protein
MKMSKTARASAKITLTLVVSSLIAGSAFAAARTYAPKNAVDKKELETCRLKKASPLGKITECRYQRQSRGKDVFMTIEMPNADCMREFQCEREKK